MFVCNDYFSVVQIQSAVTLNSATVLSATITAGLHVLNPVVFVARSSVTMKHLTLPRAAVAIHAAPTKAKVASNLRRFLSHNRKLLDAVA
jgi:phosphoglycerate-specific signal transduction histidine kinase